MWFDHFEAIAKEFEGFSLKTYRDPVGYPTQGYGHLLSRDKSLPLSTWPDITEAQAKEWLENDAKNAKRAVNRLCPGVTRDTQIAALTDFTFNLGAGYLEISTLRKRINRGENPTVDPNEFMKWVYAGGVKYSGLVRRRRAETELWNS